MLEEIRGSVQHSSEHPHALDQFFVSAANDTKLANEAWFMESFEGDYLSSIYKPHNGEYKLILMSGLEPRSLFGAYLDPDFIDRLIEHTTHESTLHYILSAFDRLSASHFLRFNPETMIKLFEKAAQTKAGKRGELSFHIHRIMGSRENLLETRKVRKKILDPYKDRFRAAFKKLKVDLNYIGFQP